MPVPLAGDIMTPGLIAATVSNLATGSVNNSTSEAVIGSMTVPSSNANQGFSFHVEGTNDNTSTASSVTFRVRLGTTGTTSDLLIVTYTAITTPASTQTGRGWSMDGWIRVITGGASGSVIMNNTLTSAITSGTTAAQPGITPVTSTVNWNVSNFLTITAQWANASTANVTRTIGGSLASLN